MVCETSEDLKFVKGGRLSVVCLRLGKEVEKVESDPSFLGNEAVIKSSSMDAVTFQSNVIFKVSLDFRKSLPCLPDSVREATDWALVSTTGATCVFNRTEERLMLQQCTVSTRSNVKQMEQPVNLILTWDDDDWVVEKCYR